MKAEEKRVSGDFVFSTNESGALEFIGDFEGLYQNDADPWGQQGTDERLNAYYAFSRQRVTQTISSLIAPASAPISILEVGCGLGYVTAGLQKHFAGKAVVSGCDISATAVEKAQSKFSECSFFVGDICADTLHSPQTFDIVIMGQLLWYLLETLPVVFTNIRKLLNPGGYLIFSQAFLTEQKYGKDIIDGFDGLVRYILSEHSDTYALIKAEIDFSKKFLHNDGIVVVQKKCDS